MIQANTYVFVDFDRVSVVREWRINDQVRRVVLYTEYGILGCIYLGICMYMWCVYNVRLGCQKQAKDELGHIHT